MKSAEEKFHEKYKVMDLQYTAYESTESLKRRVIPYKKLVVPVRMRSVYWKYFGFPAAEDGSIITKDKIVCILCKNQMIYNRNTSNLRTHLNSRHKQIMSKIDPTALIPPPKAKAKKPRLVGGDPDYEFGGMGVMGIPKKNNETKEVQVVVSEEGNDADISNIAIIFPNDVVEYNQSGKEVDEQVESNEMTDTIVNFIISDLIAPDVVDGKGFHCLMSNLSNKAVVIPNEKKLVNDIIPTMFNSCKEQLFSYMHANAISNLSLSMEEWTCADTVRCVSVYVHFSQNADACLHTRLLATVSYTGAESVGYWTNVLDRLLQEWSLNVNYVTAVIVAFANEPLLEAIKAKNLITVPCFLFTVQHLCNEYCYSNERIAPVLEKCRKLVKYLQDNRIEFRVENGGGASAASTSLIDEDDEEGGGVDDEDEEEAAAAVSGGGSCGYTMCLDRAELWLTTYFMLRSLVRKRNAIDEALLNLDSELIHIVPTEDEWRDVGELVRLMEPLKTIAVTLFEEKNSLISLLKPLVWKVNTSKYAPHDDDSPLTCHLKQCVQEALNAAYGEQEVHSLAQIATILDPRFKNFVQQEDGGLKNNVEATLVELLRNFINAEGSAEPPHSSSSGGGGGGDRSRSGLAAGGAGAAGQRTPTKKSSRLSGINSLLGNICAHKPTLTLEDKIKSEVSHYQTESSASLDECPLDWWHHMSNKCPNLTRLAYRYHCVPAIITRTGNCSLPEYLKFHQKRSILNVDIAEALLFLHANKNMM